MEPEFFGCTEYGIHTRYASDFLWFQLGITSHYGHVAVGRNGPGLPYDLPAFAIRIFRYRAGVDDEDIGCVGEINAAVTTFLKSAREGGGLREVELTAERIKGHLFHGAKILKIRRGFFLPLCMPAPLLVTSAQNPRIKALMALDKQRERRNTGLFLAEGFQEVNHALRAGYLIDTLVTCPSIADYRRPDTGQQIFQELEVPNDLFSRLAVRENTGGLLAVMKMKAHDISTLHLSDKPLVLVLEAVEKPGNLGAILRTADAAGLDAVIVCDPSTDVYNPNVVRSSVGCLFTVPLAVASSGEAFEWLRHRNIRILATHLNAAVPYHTVDYRLPSAIVMGTESTGLSDFWWKAADERIIIPMRGANDSLNVSTAAAVVIFEAVRQRLG